MSKNNNNKISSKEHLEYRGLLSELMSQMDSAIGAGVPLTKYRPFIKAKKAVVKAYEKLEKREGL